MNPEPLQVIIRYGNIIQGKKYNVLLEFLSQQVGNCITTGSKWTKGFGNVSSAVALKNINPTKESAISKLTDEQLNELIKELTPAEWGLLDNAIRVLA